MFRYKTILTQFEIEMFRYKTILTLVEIELFRYKTILYYNNNRIVSLLFAPDHVQNRIVSLQFYFALLQNQYFKRFFSFGCSDRNKSESLIAVALILFILLTLIHNNAIYYTSSKSLQVFVLVSIIANMRSLMVNHTGMRTQLNKKHRLRFLIQINSY